MRILFLTHGYPPYDLGGLTQICQEVVDLLRERGHVTHVLTSRYGLLSGARFEDGITRTLHFQADIEHYRPLDFFFKCPQREKENLRCLQRAISIFQPDFVFVWGLWNLSHALPYWAERWMTPGRVAYAIADYWPIEPDMHEAYWRLPARHLPIEWLKARIRPFVLRRLEKERCAQPIELRHAMSCSQYTATKLEEAGALSHGAKVIYNGIDLAPYLAASRVASSDSSLRLLFFGGLSESKGVHTAIEALGLLLSRDQAEGLTLTLVGSGHPDYVAHLHRLVSDLGLESHVSFYGSVPRSEIPALLSGFDVFLFTSVWEEPFGRTIIEAMAAGLVVIGAYVGGGREIMVDGENALVFPPGDAAALVDRIVRLRESPDLAQQLAEAGRRTVFDRFTLDRMVDEIEDWLHQEGNTCAPMSSGALPGTWLQVPRSVHTRVQVMETMRSVLRQFSGLDTPTPPSSLPARLLHSMLVARRRYLQWSWKPTHDLDAALRYDAVAQALATAGFRPATETLCEVGGGANCLTSFTQWRSIVADLAFSEHVLAEPYVQKCRASIYGLPFADETFDAVVCADTVENLPACNRPSAVRELLRCASRYVVLTVPCGKESQMVDRDVLELSAKLRPQDLEFRAFLAEHLAYGLPSSASLVGLIIEQAAALRRTAAVRSIEHIDREVILFYWRKLLLRDLALKGYWWGIAFPLLRYLLRFAKAFHHPYRYVFLVCLKTTSKGESDGS